MRVQTRPKEATHLPRWEALARNAGASDPIPGPILYAIVLRGDRLTAVRSPILANYQLGSRLLVLDSRFSIWWL